jgi:superfamily I DNA/RNA helicase/RecB family exonuclease
MPTTEPTTMTALTEAQAAVVGWAGGRLAVSGPAGSGKTTALVARYLRLVDETGAPSRVAVICRDRGAAGRFLDACLARLAGGFDALPISTFAGVAFDILRRAGVERRLIASAERWALLREQLAAEAATPGARERWPVLHRYLGRVALVDEVATALLRRPAPTAGGVWPELADFASRYRATLEARGLVDFPRLLELAAAIAAKETARFDHVLVDDFEGATERAAILLDVLSRDTTSAVVAGNADAAVGSQQGGSAAFLASFAAGADETVQLPRRLRAVPSRELAHSHHPALEPEAVASELLRAAAKGVPWSRMAVLVRHPAGRARALCRALARHGIPVTAPPTSPAEEPVVAALLDLLHWVDGDDGAPARLLASALSGLAPAEVDRVRREARAESRPLADDPSLSRLRGLRDDLAARAKAEDVASLAHRAFRGALAGLVASAADPDGPPDPETGRALDAAVAFLGQLDRFVEQQPGARLHDYLATLDAPATEPDPWLTPMAAAAGEAVTVTSLAAAAGREWDLVVVAGCVEGELPRWPRTGGLFGAGPSPPGAVSDEAGGVEDPGAENLRAEDPLAEERRLFGLATGAATTRLVASAAPEPGQLVSRFVAGWPPVASPPALNWSGRIEVGRESSLAQTPGVTPVWPDGVLSLSATKLTTFADCPLKFAFSYALGVRDAGSVWASLGSLFHEVAAEFLRPGEGQPDRSRERLLAIAEAHWYDDIAPYRPQREEIRRDLFDMLDAWHQLEFSTGDGPDVVDVERRFRIEVAGHTVTGSIDRVDQVPGGLEIVDYKTGKRVLRPEEVVEDLQLAVYHLAATRDPDLAAAGPARRLLLRYVRVGQDRDQPVTPDHAEQTEARILDAAEQIVAEAFAPALGADCDHCDFHRLCPLQRQGREVGAA